MYAHMCADTYTYTHMQWPIVPAAVAALPLAVDDLEGHVLVGGACGARWGLIDDWLVVVVDVVVIGRGDG